MITNTGMRTDIPAFYSDWFMNRIREGYVLVRNPYRQDWITRGVNCIGWRYDPIFLDSTYKLERHISDFETMCRTLSDYTRVCVISFIDIYEKVTRNFPQAKTVTPQERIAIGKAFADIGQRYGITKKACAEGNDLAPYGVDCDGCMTKETFEAAIGCSLDIPKKKTQRSECSCVLGTDIGAYDTCGHFCRYCYANSNRDNVRRSIRLHDPKSPFLVGNLLEGEVIHQAEQVSWINNQLSFF